MRRTQLLATVVLLSTMGALGGLLGRVAWIEKHANADELDKIGRQSLAMATIMPNRAPIRLAGGQVIAASVRMYNLYADPAYIMDPTEKTVARWELQKKLNNPKGGDPDPETLEAQIKVLDEQIDQSKANWDGARKHLAAAMAPVWARWRLQASLNEQQIAALDALLADPSVKPGKEIEEVLAQAASEILGMIQDNETYHKKDANGVVLPSDPTRDSPRRFLWLAKEVDEDFYDHFQVAKAQLHKLAQQTLTDAKGIKDQKAREAKRAEAAELAHALDGVGFQRTVKRIYPMGSMAAHVIGFASTSEGGVDGLERQFDELLKGRPGSMQLFKDAQRHTLMIEDKNYKPAENGCGITLTMDTMVQSIAEKELEGACIHFKAESGVAIVMDPYTGKILAMASYPTFDAADFPKTAPAIRRNRALTDPLEAGSVIKPFVMSWAIEHGVVTPTTVMNCEGGLWHDPTGRAVRDDYGYGILPEEDVLVKSVNVGMAKTGWMMGIPMLCEGVHKFGFGGLTGIELPGDSKGILKQEDKWNKGTLTSVSFGYEIAVTPIQLIRAFATFTNGGYLITPRMVDLVETSPGKTERWEDLARQPERRQILSTKTCDTMREMMEQVYIRGTAKSAISSIYRLYGKTGTAHLAVQGAGHYASDEYNSSFMSGGPVTGGPGSRLVTVVTLHKPDRSLGHFGGIVAAPAATRIMEQSLEYMHVAPDQVVKKAK